MCSGKRHSTGWRSRGRETGEALFIYMKGVMLAACMGLISCNVTKPRAPLGVSPRQRRAASLWSCGAAPEGPLPPQCLGSGRALQSMLLQLLRLKHEAPSRNLSPLLPWAVCRR
jgi:hypothetical protein